MTIICAGHEFHLHKLVLLCQRSHFFESALRGNFAEAKSSKIEIKDQDPAIVARMLSWFYIGSIVACLDDNSPLKVMKDAYANAMNKETHSQYNLWYCKLGIEMFAIATQFGIPELQLEACDMIQDEFYPIGTFSTSIWQSCPDGVEELVRSVYATTPEIEHGLRDIVVRSILHMRQRNSRFGCETQKLVRSIPELAMDLATCYLYSGPGASQTFIRPCSDPESDLCKYKH